MVERGHGVTLPIQKKDIINGNIAMYQRGAQVSFGLSICCTVRIRIIKLSILLSIIFVSQMVDELVFMTYTKCNITAPIFLKFCMIE